MRSFGLVLGLGLLLLGVIAVGELTRERMSDSDRFSLPFSEIDCTPPPFQDRAGFLSDVRSQNDLPDRLPLFEKNLAARLAQAFGQNPWVESVERVTLSARQVHVELSFRLPALEVLPVDASSGPGWMLDARGIVLPHRRTSEKLPLLLVTSRPKGQAGEPWGDHDVESAARTAGYLHVAQRELMLRVVETNAAGLVLSTAAGTRVFWGHAPDNELTEEAPATDKLKWLLDYCKAHGTLDKPTGREEHDVRPKVGAQHRALPPLQ
jgi:hypothetical protein